MSLFGVLIVCVLLHSDQENSKYGYFLHNDKVIISFRLIHFMPLASFCLPWFSDVFKGYRKRTQHEMG